MATAQIGPLSIEYEVTGEGVPLLLVMGLGSQLIHWPEEFVAQIADRGFRVVRFDNRDIGLSTKFTSEPIGVGRTLAGLVSRRMARAEYLLSDMADDAVGVLTHLGIDQAHIVGVSMGGMIAQSVAIGHPERTLSLTSIMSNTGDRRNGKPTLGLMRRLPGLVRGEPGPDGEMTEEMLDDALEIARLTAGPHFDSDQEREVIRRAHARSYSPAGMMRQVMAISASPDRTKALGAVTAPTLVIHGLVDPLVQPSGGIATARAVPGSRLLMFPDMAHDLPRVRWGEIIDAIVVNAGRAEAAAPALS
jgi:pimeloyl-ACP methyl ester carboxylesterase